MVKPNVIVLTGFGLNCEEETAFAFEKVGGSAKIVHLADLIDKTYKLSDYQILAIPGGFSYGDHTGSGNAFASKMKNHLQDEVLEFARQDKLAIGICNGFQIMTRLGLLPAVNNNYSEAQGALLHNDSARYTTRWVDLSFSGKSPWVTDLRRVSVPIAHGEGKWHVSPDVLVDMKKKDMIAAKYIHGNICKYQDLAANPNGSLESIAAVTDESKRIIGMMPHPERAIEFTQLPNWTLIKETCKREGKEVPKEGDGLAVFRNGVNYFS
jgi:phosphoribosylformylglycinamidine synthase subunit PurQ / glutaminase